MLPPGDNTPPWGQHPSRLLLVIDPGNVVPETNKTDNLVIFGPLP